MKNKKLLRFVHSLVLLPAMTLSMSADVSKLEVPHDSLVQKLSIMTAPVEKSAEELAADALAIQNAKATAIDAYFAKYDMPLEGMGATMVAEAEKNGLDWRLVAAISVRESTGGKHDCQKVSNNPFGWGSCKIGFKSNAAAIETVARNLGGNNPKTAHHYDDKSTVEILHAYNPPSVVPRYAEQVMNIMTAIGTLEINTSTNLASL